MGRSERRSILLMVARQIEATEPERAAAIRANVRAVYGLGERLDTPPAIISEFHAAARARQLELSLRLPRQRSRTRRLAEVTA